MITCWSVTIVTHHFFLKKIKQLKYTYTLQEASTCRTRGESEESQARKYASKGIHPGFKTQGRRHQKSKTGVSVIPQKGLMSSIKLKKYVHITFGWVLLLMDSFRCRPSYSLWHSTSRLQSRYLYCVFRSKKNMFRAQLSVNNLNKYEECLQNFLSSTAKLYGSITE